MKRKAMKTRLELYCELVPNAAWPAAGACRDVEANPSAYCGLLAIICAFAGTCAWLSGLAGTISTWIVSVLVLIPARSPIASTASSRDCRPHRVVTGFLPKGFISMSGMDTPAGEHLWMAAFILLGFVMFSESFAPGRRSDAAGVKAGSKNGAEVNRAHSLTRFRSTTPLFILPTRSSRS